jgi:uncharacterized OB-fold protein
VTARYLPAEIAGITPDIDTAPFWEGCRERQLRFQRCLRCQRFRHPPIAGCPECGSREVEWVPVRGVGHVYTFTIVHHAVVPAVASDVPYNAVLIELDDAPGVHLISNVIDAAPGDIQIGMEVEVAWEDTRPGVVLPRFKKRGSTA